MPTALIEMMGASSGQGETPSPEKLIRSEIMVNNGDHGRCDFLKPRTAYCPPGWSPSTVRQSESYSAEKYYCFKNAGKSYGDEDLCLAEGGQRIWFPADGAYKDLFNYLETEQDEPLVLDQRT